MTQVPEDVCAVHAEGDSVCHATLSYRARSYLPIVIMPIVDLKKDNDTQASEDVCALQAEGDGV